MARLRGLTLMSILAMLGVAWGLLWTGYQQRLSDRQAAIRQAVEVAHARVQLAYAQQSLGKLDRLSAQKQALAALDQLGLEAADYLWVNDAHLKLLRAPLKAVDHVPADLPPYAKGFEPWGWVIGTAMYIDDLQHTLLTETLVTLGAAMALGLLLWGLLEWTAQDLKRLRQPLTVRPASLSALVGQPAPVRPTPSDTPAAASPAETPDPVESSSQEVSRLRMAGAI
jgi:methyl-accepting chemotaxis protein